MRAFSRLLPVCLFLVLAGASSAQAQDMARFFKINCASCHTIGGGRLVGPDLKGVTTRQDRAWLADFIVDPQAKIDSGDEYARKILDEARGVVMSKVAGVDRTVALSLLTLIDEQSGIESSEYAGSAVSLIPFTADDRLAGERIFRGDQRLGSGGPACISCHTVRGLGSLGGGQLGPDLSKVYERLGARQGLTAWLGAPPTATMQSLFRDQPLAEDEVPKLVAYFEAAAQGGGEDNRAGLITFVLLGLGGAVLGLVVMDSAWRSRFRSVRRAIVEQSRTERAS